MIDLSPFRPQDIDIVFAIQQAAFKPLYEKYLDDETSPYKESKETVLRKYTRPGTVGYLFLLDGTAVGTVRIGIDEENASGRVSALCVLPQYQGRGIAQSALAQIERLNPEIGRWTLDTIAQEPGNCHLYEKLGYRRTGKTEAVSGSMTIVFYEKRLTS